MNPLKLPWEAYVCSFALLKPRRLVALARLMARKWYASLPEVNGQSLDPRLALDLTWEMRDDVADLVPAKQPGRHFYPLQLTRVMT